MLRILLLALLIFALLYLTGYGRSRLRALSPQRRRHLRQGLLLLAPLVIAVGLVVSGRLPALWASLVALWPPLLRGLVRLLWLSPTLRGWFSRTAMGSRRTERSDSHHDHPGDARSGSNPGGRSSGRRSGGMDRAEALSVLGLSEGASPADIEAAHRRLAGKVHPDLGGSDYLTAQINRARDVLLGRR